MNNDENNVPKGPGIPIPQRTEEEENARIVRPPSHNVGMGGVLTFLYRNLISNLTNGQWFSPVVINKLMNDYLDKQAIDNPGFNRSNDRNNLMKTLNARAITFKSLCKLLVFSKFTKITITIDGVREDGGKASASIDVNFTTDMPGVSKEKEEDV